MKDEVIINQSPPIATSSLLVVDDNSMNRIMLSHSRHERRQGSGEHTTHRSMSNEETTHV